MSSAPQAVETAAPLISERERFFFGVGLVILPPFWSWWTLRRRFTDRQRLAAFTWSTIYLVALLATWDLMSDRFIAVVLHFPEVCAEVTFALGLWLVLRLFSFWQCVCGLIMSVDIIAILSSLAVPTSAKICARMPWWDSWPSVLPVILLGLLHLAVDPTRRTAQRLRAWSTPWLARHRMRW